MNTFLLTQILHQLLCCYDLDHWRQLDLEKTENTNVKIKLV